MFEIIEEEAKGKLLACGFVTSVRGCFFGFLFSVNTDIEIVMFVGYAVLVP